MCRGTSFGDASYPLTWFPSVFPVLSAWRRSDDEGWWHRQKDDIGVIPLWRLCFHSIVTGWQRNSPSAMWSREGPFLGQNPEVTAGPFPSERDGVLQVPVPLTV